MSRYLATVGLAAAVLGLALWSATARTEPPQKQRTSPPRHATSAVKPPAHAEALPRSADTREVYQLLDRRVTVAFPPNSTIEDGVNLLKSKAGVSIIIDDNAFMQNPDSKDRFPEGISKQTIILPELKDLRTAEVLRLMLDRVYATFVVRDGTVFIVPREFVTTGEVLRQPVTIAFAQMPLSMALEALADRTGATIVVDPRLGANATVPVTANFGAVPVETAASLLANMSDLGLMEVGSVLYVTNPDNARAFRVELEQRRMPLEITQAAKPSPTPQTSKR